jgi:UDP-glucuronate 4-epimerase
MKILVTGGAGFIGSHVVEALLRRGDQVTVVDDFNDYYDPAIKRRNLAAVLDHPSFRLVEGDIRDRVLIESLLEETFEAVVHLAARAGVRPSLKDPVLYETVNVIGLLNLLEGAIKFGKPHFVFASSSSVYGLSPRLPWREDDPVDCPISPYAVTKRMGELLCYNYNHIHGLDTVALRFFTVYGPRQRPDMAIAKFTRAILHGEPITVYGDGSAIRDFTYVGDIVEGVLAAVDRRLGFELVNLGGAQSISVLELIQVVSCVVGRDARLVFQKPFPGDVPATLADSTKAKHLLGLSPQTTIEEGLRRYLEWLGS